MTKVLVVLSALFVSASAFASTSVSVQLASGGKAILTLDSGFDMNGYACATAAAESAATLFLSKYHVSTVYVDQVKYAQSGSAILFTVRASANIGGQWRHQFSTVAATANRSCSAGGASLTSESAD